MGKIKKMDLKKSILFFGIPGILLFINCEYFLPVLLDIGLTKLYAVLLMMAIPIIFVFMFVLLDFKASSINKSDFLYMKPLSKKQVLIAVSLSLLVQSMELVTTPTRIWLSHLPGFNSPNYYPEIFMPQYEIHFPIKTFMDVELTGNYMVIVLWACWLVVNILGEEIVWRGYALKRMELRFGKWAWLINGILWNFLVHFFIRWSYVSLIPVSFIVPWICQKTKSFWPGVIIHGIGNLLVYIIILPGVFN